MKSIFEQTIITKQPAKPLRGSSRQQLRACCRTFPSLFATLLSTLLFTGCAREPVDLLITGGTVIDGSGEASFEGGIAIREGVIVAVGEVGSFQAAETIDASGLVVAPGFIDVHNHTAGDIARPERKLNEGFLRQGVTTVVAGPDGSLAPAQMAELIEAYQQQGIGTNVAFYVGHNAIRRQVMGTCEERQAPPSADHLEEMKALVRRGMDMGAVGLSTGLMYDPGMFSQTDEVIALAREVQPFGGIYDSHVRNPVHAFLESDQEVLEIAEAAGIPGKIGHIKGVGLHNEGVIREIIALVEEARTRGVEIVSDQYPYDGAATAELGGIIVIPPELPQRQTLREMVSSGRREEARVELKKLLANPRRQLRLKEASENGVAGGFAWLKATGYSSMRITSSDDYPELVGKYLSEISEERAQDPFQTVCQLIIGADQPVFITLGAIKEPDVQEIMRQSWNMIASDGGYADGSDGPGGHPRSAGTFPRFLGHYVREVGLLSLQEAVRKITSLPAEFLSLVGRGRLQSGYAADITIFDPETISDRSTWTQPQLFSEGVHHVLVNGILVLREGKLTGEAPGQALEKAP